MSAETLNGEESNVIESIWLKPFLNDQKLFDLNVFINLKKNMADYVYTELKRNPHRNVGVSVSKLFYSRNDDGFCRIHTSNEDLADNIDRSTGSKYFLELGCTDKQVTYRVFVKSLWADELYGLEIDTRSFEGGRPLARVAFRLV